MQTLNKSLVRQAGDADPCLWKRSHIVVAIHSSSVITLSYEPNIASWCNCWISCLILLNPCTFNSVWTSRGKVDHTPKIVSFACWIPSVFFFVGWTMTWQTVRHAWESCFSCFFSWVHWKLTKFKILKTRYLGPMSFLDTFSRKGVGLSTVWTPCGWTCLFWISVVSCL